MKVLTTKQHKIYFSDREVNEIRKLMKENRISMSKLSRELGITTMSLWRKFARKTPFFYLEIKKMDYLGILYAEDHQQIIRLHDELN